MRRMFYLKPATPEDVDLIFEWANDEDERRNSFNPEKIEYENHCKWYKSKLESDDTFIFIYCEDDKKLGQVRIEIEQESALISYFVDKKYRQMGHGKRMLKLLREKVKTDFPQVKKLVAQVKTQNIASQKVFEALGYNECLYFEQKL